VGLLLARRRPENPMGWVLLGVVSLPALGTLLPVEGQTASLGFGVAVTMVLFPTGRLPSRAWLAPLSVLATTALLGGFVDIGSVALGDIEVPIWVVLAAIALIWCASAPAVRFRRAGSLERTQLRWLGLVAGAAGVAVLVAGLAGLVGPRTAIGGQLMGGAGLVVVGVLLFGLPGAILIAVLRFRLYEIDRIVSRTVTFGVVAAVVAVVYAGPILLLPELLGTTGDLVTAGSTLIAAAVFSPVRRRVQRMVGRRFNRSAYDAQREVARVAEMLQGRIERSEVVAELERVLRTTLHPSRLAVWLHPD
jgi:hypothetical protein